PPELELAKDYVNFYSRSQLQTSEILASHESSGEDFMLYFEKYLKALYFANDDLGSNHKNISASPELSIINNPIKSKAVG
ncbi:16934_t:CDS:2, partial [Dentiscutata heterogama]